MVLEKIRQLYPQLTKSQRRIADFVVSSYKEMAFMTAARLASRLAVNEATIIRFAQRLGYPGYPELVEEVRALVQEELRTVYEPAQVLGTQESLLRALRLELEALQRTLSHISPQLAREAMEVIAQAERIYVLGQGLSWPLAQLLSLSLCSLGLLAEAVPADPLSLALMLERVDERCVLICMVAASDSLELASAMRQGAQRGARTLVLSESPVSACAQAAEVTLTYLTSDSFVVPSVTALAALGDALVQALAVRDVERAKERLRALEGIRERLAPRRHR